MKKIKILLITSMPWREDNNIGNSYSNLFGDIDKAFEVEGAIFNSIYFKNQKNNLYIYSLNSLANLLIALVSILET